MKPSIGRIVQYKLESEYVFPAIITAFVNDEVTLTVFTIDATTSGVKSSSMAAGPREAKPGQWWWPERI